LTEAIDEIRFSSTGVVSLTASRTNARITRSIAPSFGGAMISLIRKFSRRGNVTTEEVLSTPHFCPVCGAKEFTEQNVLWEELVKEWELNDIEVEYINKQQGFSCSICNNNLRSMLLAETICVAFGSRETLCDFMSTRRARRLAILEINEAGGLTKFLRSSREHRLITYPESDMMALQLPDRTFDVVVHSDTVEHVEDPVRGLSECHRVLKPGGVLAYTVPVIVERLNRSRKGLPNSYHGSSAGLEYLVHTEFGADFWTLLPQAGFGSFSVRTMAYPAAIAIAARR
jgi:hypothetical protein